MSAEHSPQYTRVAAPLGTAPVPASHAAPAWWVVCTKELHQLWVGGKAPLLLFLFLVLQSALIYLMVSNVSDPTPPKEMLYFTLENAIAFGLLIGLIVGADSISGERERSTLEAMLLTPMSRRQLITGKFLAGISPWPAALIITIPLLVVLAQGDEALGPALLWGTIMGTLLAASFTALGMVVSSHANANKTSFAVSLLLYLVFYIPTQLPSGGQAGKYGRLLKRLNPMESNGHFLEKVLVNNRGFAEFWPWLASPVGFAVIVFVMLFIYPVPEFDLEAGGLGCLLPLAGKRTETP